MEQLLLSAVTNTRRTWQGGDRNAYSWAISIWTHFFRGSNCYWKAV